MASVDAILVDMNMNNEVDTAKKKFKDEFEFSKMDTMIHRFPAGLGGISTKYPSMVVPRFVAIGPYHHDNKELRMMEEVKKAAAYYFCRHINQEPEYAYKAVLAVVGEARKKYIADETSTDKGMMKMKDDVRFAAMLFRDACFLLLYMEAYNRSYGEREDHVVNKSMRRFLFANRDSIDNDIMLLENQIPWLVIQVLMRLPSEEAKKEQGRAQHYSMTENPGHATKKEELLKSVGKFIYSVGKSFKIHEIIDNQLEKYYKWDDVNNPPAHLLALLRRHKTEIEKPDKIHSAEAEPGTVVVQLPHNNNHPLPPSTDLHQPLILPAATPTSPPPSQEETPQHSHQNKKKYTSVSSLSSKELKGIGIVLTASQYSAAFSDMGFDQGRLWSNLTVAPLSLSNTRASWLVNMAALEVCTASRFGDHQDRTAVCSYLALLAFFMVGREDVRRLQSKSLLHGPHSDKDMLVFFKTVATHLPVCGKHFAVIMAEIQRYKENRPIQTALYKWIYNNYKTIFTAVSVIVAFISFYKGILSLIPNNC